MIEAGSIEQWSIKFPDFPTLCFVMGKEALAPLPYGPVVEKCCKQILDYIITLIDQGMQPPAAHTPLSYRPFVDVEIDVDTIRNLCTMRN